MAQHFLAMSACSEGHALKCNVLHLTHCSCSPPSICNILFSRHQGVAGSAAARLRHDASVSIHDGVLDSCLAAAGHAPPLGCSQSTGGLWRR